MGKKMKFIFILKKIHRKIYKNNISLNYNKVKEENNKYETKTFLKQNLELNSNDLIIIE